MLKTLFKPLIKKICQEEMKELKEKVLALEKVHHNKQDEHCCTRDIRIENMRVDKIEYNIEFGELEIESLSGKLNIGANYPLSAKWLEDARIQKEPAKKRDAKNERPQPEISLRPRTFKGDKH
ncbi:MULTISPECIES: spore germination protein GerPC [Bacillus]|uniref:spore germination protein GerPC n=1 Tax=Bacillus TaxID=1386 RepID=UPI001583AF04|nr:spore germination protein GerPC [Bacillus glycinifermentans]MBU8784997.1 spore germination protein GerPC [Bacillus glycinifermentans]NUJ15172.1 hypothetical protein [Bacillus glycinifermentans]